MDQTQAAAAVLVQDYPAAGLDESQVCCRNDAGAFIAAARAQGLPVAVLATLHENLDPTPPATGWSRKVALRFWTATGGAARGDKVALVATTDRLQAIFPDDVDLAEIGINPFFAGATGTKIVDALIHAGA